MSELYRLRPPGPLCEVCDRPGSDAEPLDRFPLGTAHPSCAPSHQREDVAAMRDYLAAANVAPTEELPE